MGIVNYAAFLASCALFTLTPGIDSIFVLNKTFGAGRRAGFAAIAGITLGNCFHILLCAFGIALVVAHWPLLFDAIRYLGAAYMAYLGVSVLWGVYKGWGKVEQPCGESEGRVPEQSGGRRGAKSHLISGLLTNLLNAKVPLFFLAFFPQFIAPDHAQDPLPFIILGTTMAGMGVVWFIILTLLTGVFWQKLRKGSRASIVIEILTGLVFIALAVAMLTGGAESEI